MTTYAHAFREIVVPDLRRAITLGANDIAAGRTDWSGAYYEVVHLAVGRGALWLPDFVLSELEEWIAVRLIQEADRACDAVDRRREFIARVLSDVSATLDAVTGV